VSALSSDEVATDASYRRQLVGEVLAMTERLNHVVGNLLDMSRLSSGVMSLHRDWHDPLDLISVALESTKRELSGHVIRTETDEHLPLVRVDFQFMTQAVANILSNAAIYSPRGTPIVIGCHATGAQLSITVSDSGPGIPEAERPKIFTKFYRVPGAPTGGVGLGLAITKTIVETHGGRLSAVNQPTGGARFEIQLPVEAQPTIPREADPS
jgi:two-component system sensor histidine kinase KdpD